MRIIKDVEEGIGVIGKIGDRLVELGVREEMWGLLYMMKEMFYLWEYVGGIVFGMEKIVL